MAPIKDVLIVGAGPAGLMLGLLLSRAKIPVRILERDTSATLETRALLYNASSQAEFKRAGIYEEVMTQAMIMKSVGFRDLSGKRLFGLPGGPGHIVLPQAELTAIIERHLREQKNAEILWGHAVVGLGQDDANAWVDVESPGGRTRLQAAYVVGCDGGSSAVRRNLLGKEAMHGFTWDKQLVAADIRIDLPSFLPDADDSNLFLDPENAWIAFHPSKKDERRWRIIYRDIDGLDEEELIKRASTKFEELIPGRPKSDQYEIIGIRAYKIHQRLVEKMRLGRFMLAGDAAHLCCPYGALGLNTAVADVGTLYDCLMAIQEDKADDSILDVYSDARREKFQKIVDPQSQGTLRSVFSDPSDLSSIPMYKFSQLLKNNPEIAKKNAPDPMVLRYDISAHLKV